MAFVRFVFQSLSFRCILEFSRGLKFWHYYLSPLFCLKWPRSIPLQHLWKVLVPKILISFGSTRGHKFYQLEMNFQWEFYLFWGVLWFSVVSLQCAFMRCDKFILILWCFFLFFVGGANWADSTCPGVRCGFQAPSWIFISIIIWELGKASLAVLEKLEWGIHLHIQYLYIFVWPRKGWNGKKLGPKEFSLKVLVLSLCVLD